MTESLNQKKFNRLVMYIALAACFKPNEEFLSEDQIIVRGYAPTEYFGKCCISSLIDSGMIEFKRIDPTFPLSDKECTLFIRSPLAEGESIDDFIYKHAENIVKVLKQSENHMMYLNALAQEVIACECIEYCEYYAQRARLTIKGASHSNAKLRLLILECDADKIQMLMWKAVKILSNDIALDLSFIEFSDIIDITFDRYLYYKKIM